MLFPKRRDEDGNPAKLQATDLSMITGDAEKLAEIRRRLSNILFFYRPQPFSSLIGRRLRLLAVSG